MDIKYIEIQEEKKGCPCAVSGPIFIRRASFRYRSFSYSALTEFHINVTFVG